MTDQTPDTDARDAETLARMFHETYERLAPSFGYETRPDTKAFDPTTPNGRLMIAVCDELRHRLAAASADERVEATLVSRKIDDDCGCPEEYWDTPFGLLHMHLSAGKPSNACLDNGDEGERHIDLTCATIDEARAAIFGWAGVPTPARGFAGGEREAVIVAAREAAALAFDARARKAAHPTTVTMERHHAKVIRQGEGDDYDAVQAAVIALERAALAHPTATGGREREADIWRERWYGSEPQRGSAIVDREGNLIAYFGGDRKTHQATTAAVSAHNAVVRSIGQSDAVLAHPDRAGEVGRLREAARAAHDVLIELNLSNYTHDDVVEANDAAVEAILLLADALGERHGKTPEWWAARRAALNPGAAS